MVSEQQLERCFELGLKSFVNEAQFFTCLLNAMVYVHALDRPAFRRHPVAIIDGNDRGVYGQQQAVHV